MVFKLKEQMDDYETAISVLEEAKEIIEFDKKGVQSEVYYFEADEYGKVEEYLANKKIITEVTYYDDGYSEKVDYDVMGRATVKRTYYEGEMVNYSLVMHEEDGSVRTMVYDLEGNLIDEY